MTTEERQLLLKDLCARLSYITYYDLSYYGHKTQAVLQEFIPAKESLKSLVKVNTIVEPIPYENIKPYLRPLSNMTEEEEKKLKSTLPFSISFTWDVHNEFIIYTDSEYDGDHYFSCFVDIQDWLNEHHFDYRGLIEKGLALEAPEDMYKEE